MNLILSQLFAVLLLMSEPAVQTMPQSNEAEIAVLGAFLTSEDAVADFASRVSKDHFYQRSHGIIFSSIEALHNEGKPADLITVTDHLRTAGKLDEIGGSFYLSRLTVAFPTSAHCEQYVEILDAKYRLRRILESAADVTASIYTGSELAEVLPKLEESVFEIAESRKTENLTTSSVDYFVAEVQRKINGEKVTGMKTGVFEWDRAVGGLVKSRLYVIAARPGDGKTALATQMIRRFCNEKEPVMIFSQDMAPEMFIARAACSEAGFAYSDYEANRLSALSLRTIERAALSLKASPLHIHSPSSLTATEFRSAVRKAKRLHGIKAVFLDHIQLIDTGKDELREGLTKASLQIVRSVKDTGIPHVIISQLNREAEKTGRPSPSHIKEFDQLFADCDVMALIYSEVSPATLAPGQMRPMKIYFGKNRYGSQTEEEMLFDGQTLNFRSKAFGGRV